MMLSKGQMNMKFFSRNYTQTDEKILCKSEAVPPVSQNFDSCFYRRNAPGICIILATVLELKSLYLIDI
jgi:hypothetical protein